MNTQDYLEQLEQDREDLVDNLETKGITGLTGDETFTALVPEVLNIQTGGDLSEYFNTNVQASGLGSSEWANDNIVKKLPDFTIQSNYTSTQGMFSNWKLSKVPKVICSNSITDMRFMYGSTYNNSCGAIEIDLSGLNTSNVVQMSDMFNYASRLTSLNLSNFVTTKVTTFSSMFYGCTQLTSLDVSSFGASPCNNYSSMFYGCSKLTSLDLSSLNTTSTSSTINASQMFYNCKALTRLDIRSFDFTKLTSYNNMFGSSSSNGPANNCLIIVADDTQKTWINTKFSRLTNVQTVAEYEASLNQ